MVMTPLPHPPKVLVLGGNGFVGRALCREAIRRGWIVSSLSRRGEPEDASQDGLLKQVKWHKGNALESSVYPSILAAHDYVIHSIGTLFESNPIYNLYKNNPVQYETSYKALIRDTAEVASAEAAKAGIKAFGYVSAASYGFLGNLMLPKYMAMKAEAELLLAQHSEFRKVIVRPGFMYGSDRWLTIPMSFGATAMTIFTGGVLPKPLSVDTVARSMMVELEQGGGESEAAAVILEACDISRVGSL